jgi:threonine synthase
MRYVSTRAQAPPATFSEALLQGLAPDGGLYVPEEFPLVASVSFAASAWPAVAAEVMRPFFAADALAPDLPELCEEAFDFPAPLVDLGQQTALLELFHGPTASFKDFGARFLAGCFRRLLARGPEPGPLTVLVATSGDTGAAVAAACHRSPRVEVGVLFPKGGVAPRQEHQLTCWDENVRSFAVRGTFDDCQRMVKAVLNEPGRRRKGPLSSANSINIGRLLPQAAYYAASALQYRAEHDAVPGFIVPSGNVGNAVAAFWAKRMGFPIGRIVLATNANTVVPDWFRTGRWQPRPARRTLANAMDVGAPSNMERLFHLYPDRERLLAAGAAQAVDDDTIRQVIAAGPRRWGRVFCPHTATAVHVREQLDSPHWIVVATAHPAKFESIVEPLIGEAVEVPPRLAELLARPTRVTEIDPELAQLDREWNRSR